MRRFDSLTFVFASPTYPVTVGTSAAVKIPMITITTISSTSVKPLLLCSFLRICFSVCSISLTSLHSQYTMYGSKRKLANSSLFHTFSALQGILYKTFLTNSISNRQNSTHSLPLLRQFDKRTENLLSQKHTPL